MLGASTFRPAQLHHEVRFYPINQSLSYTHTLVAFASREDDSLSNEHGRSALRNRKLLGAHDWRSRGWYDGLPASGPGSPREDPGAADDQLVRQCNQIPIELPLHARGPRRILSNGKINPFRVKKKTAHSGSEIEWTPLLTMADDEEVGSTYDAWSPAMSPRI